MFTTPILLIVFNRKDKALLVFEEIKKQKPKYLFIAADGPRLNKEGEAVRCRDLRESILSRIDWDCEVKTLFQKQNHGCGLGVYSAISWFFEQVEEGIILEDDCLPHPDFFAYCADLLSRYRNDEQIGFISGTNLCGDKEFSDLSYLFSYMTAAWGWATWRRVWKDYDFKKRYSFKEMYMIANKTFDNYIFKRELLFRNLLCNLNKFDTWDFQFIYFLYERAQLGITPKKNLISNIGIDEEATHLKDKNLPLANLPTFPILPLVYDDSRQRNKKYEYDYFMRYNYKKGYRYFICFAYYLFFVKSKKPAK